MAQQLLVVAVLGCKKLNNPVGCSSSEGAVCTFSRRQGEPQGTGFWVGGNQTAQVLPTATSLQAVASG